MTDMIPGSAFREALAHFASGVTIVAARGVGGPVGFTATGFTSVSLAPPLILVCIGKTASAHEGVVGSDLFGVSVLGEDQRWIAEQFARSGVDRFAGVPSTLGPVAGAPLIAGALAHLECRPHARHDAGDHTLLIGQVLGASVIVGRPLLHFARRFGAFAPGDQVGP
jgi:flavin reductase (DIM6/NTAB) family NADH-FMN oxidoreductase RutF